jgi:hypothetical protein
MEPTEPVGSAKGLCALDACLAFLTLTSPRLTLFNTRNAGGQDLDLKVMLHVFVSFLGVCVPVNVA